MPCIVKFFSHSAIAQLVERMTVNHDVVGSSPTCGVFFFTKISKLIFAVLAQQVERFHGKEEVTGSTPVNGFILIF